jgi:hypothetical protein
MTESGENLTAWPSVLPRIEMVTCEASVVDDTCPAVSLSFRPGVQFKPSPFEGRGLG